MTFGLGIRGRLAMSIAAILAAALSFTFYAVHRGTESDLQGRLDDDLRASSQVIAQRLAVPDAREPAAALTAARAYVDAQGFGRASQLIAVTIPGAGIATNQPELLGLSSPGSEPDENHDSAAEHRQADAIRAAPDGFTRVSVERVGPVRILTTHAPTFPGGPAATIRVGEPMASVDRAIDGLTGTFFIVGGLTLAFGILAGLLLATRMMGPVREMAHETERIDAGELSRRLRVPSARDELRLLAASFNGLLDRLQRTFAGQKRFVADASHELRTPLTVIRGQLEVLGRSRDVRREDVERVSGMVNTEVNRMEQMVEELLSLARGETVAHRRPTELAPLAREAFESLAVTADRRFEVAPGNATAAVDAEQVSQLVRTLTRNAIEHTEAGGRLRLTLAERGEEATITVEDDGPGIPPEERERVFERFHRVAASRERARGGAGLGLAIARAIAEAHGGTVVAADSALGGAALTVRLPREPPA